MPRDDVYESLSAWVEERVRGRKLRWMIALPSGIGAVATAVGAFLQISLIVNVSLIFLAGWLGAWVIVMALDRRTLRREARQAQGVLRQYGDTIRTHQTNSRDLFHIVSWNEEVTVSKNGDAVIVRRLTLRAGPEDVPAVWALSKRNTDSHLETRVRERVRVRARWWDPTENRPGPRIVTSLGWEEEGRLRVYLHFDRAIEAGTDVSLMLRIEWPFYAHDILDGQSEIVHWTARRRAEHISSRYRFEKSFSRQLLNVDALPRSPKPTVTRDESSGATEIHLDLREIEVDREYGYRVDLAD